MVASLRCPASPFVSGTEPARGELCFAVLLFKPPRGSRWRPRSIDAIPPLGAGRRLILAPRLELASVLADVAEINAYQLSRMRPGRAPRRWAVAVSLVCGFDETARVVKGGAH